MKSSSAHIKFIVGLLTASIFKGGVNSAFAGPKNIELCPGILMAQLGEDLGRIRFEKAWEIELTDPQGFDPSHFLLAVHAVPRGKTKIRLENERRAFEVKQGIPTHLPMIDLFTEPERVSEIPRLSLSLVSQDRSFTLGPSGVILKFDGSQVISTLPKDSRTGGWRFSLDSQSLHQENRQIRERRQSLLTPRELIGLSSPEVHNEVMISNSHQTKVVGLFYKTDGLGNPLITSEELLFFKQLTLEKGFPLIPISGGSWRNDETGEHFFPAPIPRVDQGSSGNR